MNGREGVRIVTAVALALGIAVGSRRTYRKGSSSMYGTTSASTPMPSNSIRSFPATAKNSTSITSMK